MRNSFGVDNLAEIDDWWQQIHFMCTCNVSWNMLYYKCHYFKVFYFFIQYIIHKKVCITSWLFNIHTLRRKGSISATYLEPLKGSTVYTLKKGFLWVLYRTLGFHTWPIEHFAKKKEWFYIEPFWSSIYEVGDGTISK